MTIFPTGTAQSAIDTALAGGSFGSGNTAVEADYSMFGNGTDGDLTITSTGPSLTRDTFYRNVTISSIATLNLAGFRLYVSGTLDLTNAGANAIRSFANNGINGPAATGTATGGSGDGGPANVTAIGKSTSNGGNGGLGTTTIGNVGVAVANTVTVGGAAGAGGLGGTGSGGAAGAGGAANTGTAVTIGSALPGIVLAGNSFISAGQHASGGGAGSGDTTNAGGGGGGGGCAANSIMIYARVIARGVSTAAGAIHAYGGHGGAGSNGLGGNAGGGGGGAGSGGSYIHIVCLYLTGTVVSNMLDVTGGIGGLAGNGVGTGTGGTGGSAGASGCATVWVLSAGTRTQNGPNANAVVAGSGPTGTAGGAGGVPTTTQYSL